MVSAKSNVKLNFLSNLSSFRCVITKGHNVSRILHGLFVRRSCVQCLSTMESSKQESYMKAKAMPDICQTKARSDYFMRS